LYGIWNRSTLATTMMISSAPRTVDGPRNKHWENAEPPFLPALISTSHLACHTAPEIIRPRDWWACCLYAVADLKPPVFHPFACIKMRRPWLRVHSVFHTIATSMGGRVSKTSPTYIVSSTSNYFPRVRASDRAVEASDGIRMLFVGHQHQWWGDELRYPKSRSTLLSWSMSTYSGTWS